MLISFNRSALFGKSKLVQKTMTSLSISSSSFNSDDLDFTLKKSEATVARLQEAARALQASSDKDRRKSLVKLVTLLEQIARRRNDLLKRRWEHNAGARDAAEINAVNKAQVALIRTLSSAGSIIARVVDKFPELDVFGDFDVDARRAAVLVEDARALSVAKTTYPNRPVEMLERIVARLREAESSYDFHGQIICDADALLPPDDNDDDDDDDDVDDDYSLENFAYGSTPLSTWLRLMEEIQSEGHSPEVSWGVMGSSCGWMVFYASVISGRVAHGWEILPSLHQCAVRVAEEEVASGSYEKEHDLMRDLMQFHCEDALKANVAQCGAIVIAGQCWEAWLLHAMYKKIRAECGVGTLLLDYNGGLSELLDKEKKKKQDGEEENKTTEELCLFRLLFVLPLPVSWGTVEFHVWVLEGQ